MNIRRTTLPRHTDPETSYKGFEEVKLRATGQRYKLLQAYAKGGKMIPDEAVVLTDISHRANYWHRVGDLRDIGLVQLTGRERRGKIGGGDQREYMITRRGRTYLLMHPSN